MIAVIIAVLAGFGSLFLGGAISRSRARNDMLTAGQATIGWICLVVISCLAFYRTE